jgi:hypothetical protein
MKKKKRNRSNPSERTAGLSYRPLPESESISMQEEIKRDFREEFGQNDPILLTSCKEKMSEVLIEFASPFLEKYGSGIGMSKKIIALSIVGWNMAIVPPNEKRALIANVLRTLPASQRINAESLLRVMEERKKKYFMGINRYIIDFKFKETADSFNVFVVSTPTKEQMDEIRKNGEDLTSLNLEKKEYRGTNANVDNKSVGLRSSIISLLLSKLKKYLTRSK